MKYNKSFEIVKNRRNEIEEEDKLIYQQNLKQI